MVPIIFYRKSRVNISFMTVPMSRDVSNFQVQVQLFRLLSFTYVESHRDYLTVESTDVVSCKAFSDVRLRSTFVLK